MRSNGKKNKQSDKKSAPEVALSSEPKVQSHRTLSITNVKGNYFAVYTRHIAGHACYDLIFYKDTASTVAKILGKNLSVGGIVEEVKAHSKAPA